MHRAAATVLVALVVALAGCGGATTETTAPDRDTADATEPATTTTPSPNPTTTDSATPATTTPPPSDEGLPVDRLAWVNESGIDTTALFRAHTFTVTNASSYTTSRTLVLEERGGDAENVRMATLRASQTQDRALVNRTRRSTTADGSDTETSAEYRTVTDDGDVVYVRTQVGGEVNYRVLEDPYRSFDTFYDQATLYEQLRLVESFAFEFDRTVTVDGRPAYRFTADSFRADPPSENATDPTATLVVDDRGVIRSLSFSYDTVSGGTPATFSLTFETRDLGETTVSAPDWLDDADANASGRVAPGVRSAPSAATVDRSGPVPALASSAVGPALVALGESHG